MKILVINSDCIQVNSSANLCHLAYLRGLKDAGHDIVLLSSDGDVYQKDPGMLIPAGIKHFTYSGMSLYERLSIRKRGMERPSGTESHRKPVSQPTNRSNKKGWVNKAKKIVFHLYGVHGIYGTFVRKAWKFRSDEEYDLIVSLSTPPSSHLLAYRLLRFGHVKAKRWIQIWEDPWYSDAYGFSHKRTIFDEEKRLLAFAQRVCYVSPITLENQKRLFPEAADKMFWEPLPSYYEAESSQSDEREPRLFGYFGAYSPTARQLAPFYEAAKQTGIFVNICGDPAGLFPSTEKIHIYPRMQLEELRPFEAKTDVLVFLCNRKGGQIPGKIYQYAATDKTVLFILDGTEEEKKILRDFFEPYHRFVFCENNVEDIAAAIERIQRGELGNVVNRPLTDFDPVKIVNRILEEGMK